MKTALLTSIIAQGTPLLAAADVSSPEIARFVGAALRVRTHLAGLLQPPSFTALRELTWFNERGASPAWDDATSTNNVLGVSIREGGVLGRAACLVLSCSWHTVTLQLPPTSGTAIWHVLLDSGSPPPNDVAMVSAGMGRPLHTGSTYDLAPKGALLLAAVPRKPSMSVSSSSAVRPGAAGALSERASEYGRAAQDLGGRAPGGSPASSGVYRTASEKRGGHSGSSGGSTTPEQDAVRRGGRET
jgi:hypothetical protein